MRDSSYAQVFVMAAIVATMLLPPVAGIAWLVALLADLPFPSLVTFGDRVGAAGGVVAWWAIFFAMAIVYAAGMRKVS